MVTIVFWIYLLLFPHIVETEPAENCLRLDSLKGEWLNKKYIETVQLTKSPRKASEDIYYTAFIILKELDSYTWSQNYNFHEGITYRITGLRPASESNMYQIHYEPIYEPETPKTIERVTYTNIFLIYGKPPINEITWIFKPIYGYPKDEEQRITFVRVEPNVHDYVNRIVLAGTYTDEKGRIFVFEESGRARWPDRHFDYKIGLDFVFSESNFIMILDDRDERGIPQTYGFEWRDNKLLIFKGKYSEESGFNEFVREDNPVYILTPR